MARPKSFVASIEMDEAQRAHNCQHNAGHRILKGERRLKLKVERTSEHFCRDCAIKFLKADVEKLEALIAQLSAPG
jgi:hypothetical protein